MLSCEKLNTLCQKQKTSVDELAGHLARGGFSKKDASIAIKNWKKSLLKPKPSTEDVERLAKAFGVEPTEISQWQAHHMYVPMSPKKARLVTNLIAGRGVQEALDILKFTNKRAAYFVNKVLKSAVANADEGHADVDDLYVSEARTDSGGIRLGTKRWIPKDRGKANPIRKMASHIHVTVTEI